MSVIDKKKDRLNHSREKHMNKLIKKLQDILDSIITGVFTRKRTKLQSHFPLSNGDINYNTSGICDDMLLIVFGEKKPKQYFEDIYNRKYEHSFTLSEKTIDQHKEYIQKKLEENINNLHVLKYHHTPETYDKYFKDCTNEHKRNDGSLMYKWYYVLNIFPFNTFVNQKGVPTKIARSYAIAKDFKDVMHIFFESKDYFKEHFEKESKRDLINEFNSRIESSNISSKILTIIENLNRIGDNSITLNGSNVYYNKLRKIDEPYDDHIDKSFYFGEIISAKMIVDCGAPQNFVCTRDTDPIIKPENINMLTYNKKHKITNTPERKIKKHPIQINKDPEII